MFSEQIRICSDNIIPRRNTHARFPTMDNNTARGPHDSEGGNQELLVRAGFIRQLTSGVYSFLPMGNRVIRKISQIIREEMDRAGGQEVTMPVIQPKELWD